MDPNQPAQPPQPRIVRYAFTRPDAPLGKGESVVEDQRLIEFMREELPRRLTEFVREELPRRVAELQARLAEFERGLPNDERTRLVAREE